MQVKHVESAGENPLLARVQIHPSSSRALHTHTHTHTHTERAVLCSALREWTVTEDREGLADALHEE